jgi:4'-phosphopantetheinyl transferase
MICSTQDSTEHPVASLSPALPGFAQSFPELNAAEVHVWHADLNAHSPDRLQLFLTEDEVARANRFHFTKDRKHFIVARGLLRQLLRSYLGIVGSDDLKISYGKQGKPFLTNNLPHTLNFNLAHSHGKALYAFSRNRELGVDLEFVKDELADEQIAERFFSVAEVKALGNVPTELRRDAFFNCWTRKEAYIKARGAGLSIPLDEFDVSLVPDEPAALLHNYKDASEVDRWTMKSIPVASGYVAALVVEGQGWNLRTFEIENLENDR